MPTSLIVNSGQTHQSNWYIWGQTYTLRILADGQEKRKEFWIYRCGCGRCSKTKLVPKDNKIVLAGHRTEETFEGLVNQVGAKIGIKRVMIDSKPTPVVF